MNEYTCGLFEIAYLNLQIKFESNRIQLNIQYRISLLNTYNLSTLHPKTVRNWMTVLGFKFEPRKKSYYVDTHETSENIEYRSIYIDKYFEYEFRAHRWYSITKDKRNELIEAGEIAPDSGFEYENEHGILMYEYHVDEHPTFQKACQNMLFGGYLSVRMPPNVKKVLMLGQDEAIMLKNIFTLSAWTMLDGAQPLIPKDEGYGLMVSAITCREFGFGLTVPDYVLHQVNEKRRGKKYSDENAAIEIYGSSLKKRLDKSPFIRELEYGKNKNGYWTYDHMVVQLEDCVDVLTCMFPDFEVVFFLDHSNGHDRTRPNRLSINKLNIKYGGAHVDIRKVRRKSDKVIRTSPEEKRNLMNGILRNIENQPLVKSTKQVTWNDMTNKENLNKQI